MANKNNGFGLKEKKPIGFEEFEGKYVVLGFSTGSICGKLEDIDENGFAKFSEIIKSEFDETGCKYIRKKRINKFDLRTLNNLYMEETTEEEMKKYYSREPRNREYLGQWIVVNNTIGKLCYVDTGIIKLCPCSVNVFTEQGKSVSRLEEKIPVTMPNSNLTIIPTTEESVMNYIKHSNSKLEEKVKE